MTMEVEEEARGFDVVHRGEALFSMMETIDSSAFVQTLPRMVRCRLAQVARVEHVAAGERISTRAARSAHPDHLDLILVLRGRIRPERQGQTVLFCAGDTVGYRTKLSPSKSFFGYNTTYRARGKATIARVEYCHARLLFEGDLSVPLMVSTSEGFALERYSEEESSAATSTLARQNYFFDGAKSKLIEEKHFEVGAVQLWTPMLYKQTLLTSRCGARGRDEVLFLLELLECYHLFQERTADFRNQLVQWLRLGCLKDGGSAGGGEEDYEVDWGALGKSLKSVEVVGKDTEGKADEKRNSEEQETGFMNVFCVLEGKLLVEPELNSAAPLEIDVGMMYPSLERYISGSRILSSESIQPFWLRACPRSETTFVYIRGEEFRNLLHPTALRHGDIELRRLNVGLGLGFSLERVRLILSQQPKRRSEEDKMYIIENLLVGVPFFMQMPRKLAERMVTYAVTLIVEPNTFIGRMGDDVIGLCVLLYGEAILDKGDAQTALLPGDSLFSDLVISKGKSPVNVKTLTMCEFLVIETKWYDRVIRHHTPMKVNGAPPECVRKLSVPVKKRRKDEKLRKEFLDTLTSTGSPCYCAAIANAPWILQNRIARAAVISNEASDRDLLWLDEGLAIVLEGSISMNEGEPPRDKAEADRIAEVMGRIRSTFLEKAQKQLLSKLDPRFRRLAKGARLTAAVAGNNGRSLATEGEVVEDRCGRARYNGYKSSFFSVQTTLTRVSWWRCSIGAGIGVGGVGAAISGQNFSLRKEGLRYITRTPSVLLKFLWYEKPENHKEASESRKQKKNEQGSPKSSKGVPLRNKARIEACAVIANELQNSGLEKGLVSKSGEELNKSIEGLSFGPCIAPHETRVSDVALARLLSLIPVVAKEGLEVRMRLLRHGRAVFMGKGQVFVQEKKGQHLGIVIAGRLLTHVLRGTVGIGMRQPLNDKKPSTFPSHLAVGPLFAGDYFGEDLFYEEVEEDTEEGKPAPSISRKTHSDAATRSPMGISIASTSAGVDLRNAYLTEDGTFYGDTAKKGGSRPTTVQIRLEQPAQASPRSSISTETMKAMRSGVRASQSSVDNMQATNDPSLKLPKSASPEKATPGLHKLDDFFSDLASVGDVSGTHSGKQSKGMLSHFITDLRGKDLDLQSDDKAGKKHRKRQSLNLQEYKVPTGPLQIFAAECESILLVFAAETVRRLRRLSKKHSTLKKVPQPPSKIRVMPEPPFVDESVTSTTDFTETVPEVVTETESPPESVRTSDILSLIPQKPFRHHEQSTFLGSAQEESSYRRNLRSGESHDPTFLTALDVMLGTRGPPEKAEIPIEHVEAIATELRRLQDARLHADLHPIVEYPEEEDEDLPAPLFFESKLEPTAMTSKARAAAATIRGSRGQVVDDKGVICLPKQKPFRWPPVDLVARTYLKQLELRRRVQLDDEEFWEESALSTEVSSLSKSSLLSLSNTARADLRSAKTQTSRVDLYVPSPQMLPIQPKPPPSRKLVVSPQQSNYRQLCPRLIGNNVRRMQLFTTGQAQQ